MSAIIVLAGIPVAMGQGWSSTSVATGWDLVADAPATNVDTREFQTPAEYAAAGNILETEAWADGRAFSAPTSRTHAYSKLDQSDPTNATLRQLAEARAVYFGLDQAHPVSAGTEIKISYGLQVENLSGIPLNIVFGNHIQGVMFRFDNGMVEMTEETLIEGLAPFHAYALLNRNGPVGEGGWQNALFSTTYADPYLGTLPAIRLNSFQFYGSRSFAPGESATMNVYHNFLLVGHIEQVGNKNGVALGDFTGTADLSIRAYDSEGNDLTSQIRLTYTAAPVPEPVTMAALALGLAGLARRKRTS